MKYLLLLLPFLSCTQKMDESAAIIHVLEQEAATWRAQDFKAHSACWHIQPYSKILVSTPDGMFDVPAATIQDPTSKMGDGGFAEQTNYKMDVHEGKAWVSHDEVSTSKEGVKTYSKEIRMLEKVEGQWKLVGQSIHIYKP
jgi:hypothetical protein